MAFMATDLAAAFVVAGFGVGGQAASVVQDGGLRGHTHGGALGEGGVADQSQAGRENRQESRPGDDDAFHVSSFRRLRRTFLRRTFLLSPWYEAPSDVGSSARPAKDVTNAASGESHWSYDQGPMDTSTHPG